MHDKFDLAGITSGIKFAIIVMKIYFYKTGDTKQGIHEKMEICKTLIECQLQQAKNTGKILLVNKSKDMLIFMKVI